MSRAHLFRSPASHWQPWGSPSTVSSPPTGLESPTGILSPLNGHDSPSGIASPPTEKNGISGSTTPTLSSHHGHHHARRLRQFVRPNGRKVHICHTAEEHEQISKRLSQLHPDNDFDLYVHGTPEHIDAIRELHSHHEGRRDTLREQHGDIYDQFDQVKSELDALSEELHNLTEHGVSLDANFSKFGYSAHLRTKDDGDNESSMAGGDDPHSIRHHKDRTADPLKFWKRPVIRQYFHKGLLWRSAQSGEVASFELFVDLLYVGVIGVIGDKAVEAPTGKSVLEFVIIFIISWKIWLELTMIINWFEIDDMFQRIAVLFYMICLFGFTTNIAYGFDTTYTSMISFYLAERLYAGTYYLWVAYLVPTITGTMVFNSIVAAVSAAFWIGSIHVTYPNQLALIFIAIFIDLVGTMLVWILMRHKYKSKKVSAFLTKHFDFYPAINIEHRVERNNAFVTLVFGYSVLTILFQNRASMGINAFFGKAIMGLIQAFVFNWLYFEIDQYNIHVHAIRRHYFSSIVWVFSQIPFIMGYVLAAATLSRLVLAHDCSDTNPETLGEAYVDRSDADLATGLRWYYCGGLGVALFSMGIISFCHIHKRLPNARFRKRPRLFIRACCALVIICLPLAKSLSSLDLITISTSLVVFVLILDLFGNSCAGDQFWTGGFCDEQKKKCQYSARCHVSKKKRREIEQAMKKGERVNLEELMKRTETNSSMTSLGSEKTLTIRDEEWHGGHY